MHKVIKPKILYFGTPVILISTINEDGLTNLAPMSSAWWLGQSCMLGMSTRSKTVQNLQRNGECVLNLPSADLVNNVNQLALKTGKDPVPEYKQKMGYTFEPDKFTLGNFTEIRSDIVKPSRVTECPVQLEGIVENIHNFGPKEDSLVGIEVKIIRVHVEESLIMSGTKDHIDPDMWDPLIMSFTEFYGLREKLRSSRLAEAFRPLLTN